MIQLLVNNRIASIVFAILIQFVYIQLSDEITTSAILKSFIIVVFAVVIDLLCKRYHILGKKTHMPIFIVSLLSVFFLDLEVRQLLIQGIVWIVALSLPLASSLEEWKSEKYLIYFGALIGLAQLFDNGSVFLFIPLIVFFLLTGARKVKAIGMSLLYFSMIILMYIGLLFVTDNLGAGVDLIPSISIDFSALNNVVYRGLLPFIVMLVVAHSLLFGSYTFRYPNLMKSLNRAFVAQAILCGLIIVATSDTKFTIYMVLPIAVILSTAFSYKSGKQIMPASLFALILLCIVTVYLNNTSAFP